MIALAIMEVVKTTLTNHLYKFNGILYKQLSGGPIGDDITRISASLVMFMFVDGYRLKLMQLAIYESIRLMKVYVDDLNQVGVCLPYGTKYCKGRLYIPGEGGGWRGRAIKGSKMETDQKETIKQALHDITGQLQYNYNTIQYNTIQYNTIQYNCIVLYCIVVVLELAGNVM